MKRVITLAALHILLGCHFASADSPPLSREKLLEDTRHLVQTIESVHPDPYLRGGGKIAFHRRLQHVLVSIPDSGMTAGAFYDLLQPFIASVGDAHTAVFDPRSYNPYSPGGIPLYFETAAEGLFVIAVLKEDHRHLLGALLLSVEGVPFEQIVERYRSIKGADNDYLLYRHLGGQGVLFRRDLLKPILPEWLRVDSIRVMLRLADGHTSDLTLPIPEKIDYASFIMPPTTNTPLVNDLMTTLQRTDIFYRFLDSAHQTCLLVIHDLSTYREAFEAWRSFGITSRNEQARGVYQRYHGAPPPADPDSVIAGLPSATELLRSMVQEMKDSGAKNLLIDLSQNGGGSSLLSNILLYFLYGKETALAVKGHTTEIKKYSPEYFEKFPNPTLAEINEEQPFPLGENDYDLGADYGYRGHPGAERVLREFDEVVAWMPTFQDEYTSGAFSGYYLPDNAMVLCDAGTFSSAFFVMYYLKQAGAETVGIPSAQAGNCFGDLVQFQLPNSGLRYQVSRKYFELFPGDPDRGRVMPPDHLMTYDIMASYNFDPAALLWFALDLLN